MIFSRISRVIALLMVLFGLARLGMNFLLVGDPVASQRYGTSPESLNFAFYLILLGLALGTLSEIGLALNRPQHSQKDEK